MKKHRVIILCLISVLCGILTFPTGAEVILDNNEHGMNGSITVRLVIPGTYTVTIPAELPIIYGVESTSMLVEASNVAIGANQEVEVAVESSVGKLVQTGASGTIPYTLLCNGEAFTRTTFTQNGTVPIEVAIALEDWFSAAAGDYTDTVTFHVSLLDQEVAR